MSDLGSGIDVQDLVNGQGEWTNIQEVLRSAVVDVIRAVSRVDEKFVKELDRHGKDMHEVRNHLARGDKAHEKVLKSLAERISTFEESLDHYAKANDMEEVKDQLLVFVHAKTKELASNSVVSFEQFADLKKVLEGLPSKSDFEKVISHLRQVESRNKKIGTEMAEIREEVGRLGETIKEKPDKPHYDTLTKRLLFLDRKVKAYSDKSDKHGRRIYDIEESLLQLPSKETIEELGDHIVGLVQAARLDLGEQISHATGKVNEFESLVNTKATKSDMATEMYAVTRKVEDLSAGIANKATKSDLDLFVRDLSVLETSTMEMKGKNLSILKNLDDLAKEVSTRARPRDLEDLEHRMSSAIDSRAEEMSVSVQDEITSLKQIQSDLNEAKADKQDMKKVAKQMAGMNTRFRDWHDLIRQANTRATEIEGKLAEFTTKQEHQVLQKNLTSNTTKVKLLGDDYGNLKKKLVGLKEELGTLPAKKDLDDLEEALKSKIAEEGKRIEGETSRVSDSLAHFIEEKLPKDFASKGDLDVSKEYAVREARSMFLSANESVSEIEKKLAILNSEIVDQLTRKATSQKVDQVEKNLLSKIASAGQESSEQFRQGQLRMDRIESHLEGKSDKVDHDMFTRDLSSLEQNSHLFSQQASSRLESLDSKVVSLAESLNDQVEVSKKLHMDFLQKPDRDDIKLLILAEVNAKTKGIEQDNHSQMRKLAELSTRLDSHHVLASEAQTSWQDGHDILRAEVLKVCEDVNNKHKEAVRSLKDDTVKTMETVLEGLHKHQKESNEQMLEFEQQMRHRFEGASSKLNEQHNLEVATRIENETSIAENIRKLQVHLLQLDEAHGAFQNTLKHSVHMGGDIQDKFEFFAKQVNTKLGEITNTRTTLERDVNSQVIALQKKFTEVSRDIVEAVDGRLSRCVSRSEMDEELDKLKKVVSLKSKMALNWNTNNNIQSELTRKGRQNMPRPEPPKQEDIIMMAPRNPNEDKGQRIVGLENKVMELPHKPQASVLSDKNEMGGLVRMWGDDYAHRVRDSHRKSEGDSDARNNSSGIVSLLDKSAQRILSIRTQGASKRQNKSEEKLDQVL
ncbi:hypothetical protein HOP50_12g65770 [Chloropicon primus]|uniref:Uncharacterized protein n=2 Tax=Chloropicon primus TaxID=1764295 RepID=A0A5B8MUI3_9CHLO|nr:hypothetical protein A3770_12p65550 [Chloropicon primus]UPR03249.1 hypothetical protein HOP50_12g65770 [Chloropicon primus]|eukprot:QDZ24037.1 hypothetical protein A3770_12p65550 [Chloropicon primus]